MHVSSLLEHWLDWDSNKATSRSPNHHSHSSNCDCSSRCPHENHATLLAGNSDDATAVECDSDSDDSGIGGFGNLGGSDDEEWIRQICANGCDYVNRADSDGKTILHYLLEGEEYNACLQLWQIIDTWQHLLMMYDFSDMSAKKGPSRRRVCEKDSVP